MAELRQEGCATIGATLSFLADSGKVRSCSTHPKCVFLFCAVKISGLKIGPEIVHKHIKNASHKGYKMPKSRQIKSKS